MKIAVLGSGAMGSLYGGMLFKAGHDVVLIDISKEHINTVNASGLDIDGPEETFNIKIPAAFAKDVKEIPDLIILFTKTIYSRSALKSIKHLLGPNTLVLSLQNGLGNDETVAEYIPIERIIVGTTDFPSTFVASGKIRSKGRGTTKIMRADGVHSNSVDSIAKVLNDGGFNCIVTEDVFVAIWEKVAFNSAMNTTTAATRLQLGRIGAIQEGKDLTFTIAKEVISVANAKGVKAEINRVLALMVKDFREHTDHKPSMLQDVLKKRMTEVDYINGAVIKEAKKLGMEVPVTETMYRIIKIIQSNYENIL